MLSLGIMTEEGRGTARDLPEAFRLYQAAAQKGHEPARRILERAGRTTRAEDLLDPLRRQGAMR